MKLKWWKKYKTSCHFNKHKALPQLCIYSLSRPIKNSFLFLDGDSIFKRANLAICCCHSNRSQTTASHYSSYYFTFKMVSHELVRRLWWPFIHKSSIVTQHLMQTNSKHNMDKQKPWSVNWEFDTIGQELTSSLFLHLLLQENFNVTVLKKMSQESKNVRINSIKTSNLSQAKSPSADEAYKVNLWVFRQYFQGLNLESLIKLFTTSGSGWIRRDEDWLKRCRWSRLQQLRVLQKSFGRAQETFLMLLQIKHLKIRFSGRKPGS